MLRLVGAVFLLFAGLPPLPDDRLMELLFRKACEWAECSLSCICDKERVMYIPVDYRGKPAPAGRPFNALLPLFSRQVLLKESVRVASLPLLKRDHK